MPKGTKANPNPMDAEVATINRLTKMLGDLDDAARARVLDWANRRFGASSGKATDLNGLCQSNAAAPSSEVASSPTS